MPRDRHHRHLELLSGPALAGSLGCSLVSLLRRPDLPRPVRIGPRRLWLRSEVAHLLPRRPPRYSDTVSAPELAALLATSVTQLYRLVRANIVPPPRRVGCGRSV